MELVIMRHGATPGNERRQYVGVLDHPLSEAGRAQAHAAGIHPQVERVYVTPLSRTQQTAAICFPNAEQIVVDGLQEMDFGVFAGRTADEMVDDAQYRAWVDSMCEDPCPGGESRAQVTERICAALCDLLRRCRDAGDERVILVAHGGTMMSALDVLCTDEPKRSYYEWLTGNCEGYRIDVAFDGDAVALANCRRFSELSFLNG